MYNNKDLTHMGITHTQRHRRIEMRNSLAKLPLTSPWEQWEDEEKQNREATYSLSQLLHRPQERGTLEPTND
jgi:hypothetical protein